MPRQRNLSKESKARKKRKHSENHGWPELADDETETNKNPKPRKKRKHVEKPNWLLLPYDITINIIRRLGAVQILLNVQQVCTTWHKITKDQTLWTVINMHHNYPQYKRYKRRDLDRICMNAVDRSQGQLNGVCIQFLATPELMKYIAKRSSQLSLLRLVHCHYSIRKEYSWRNFFKKVPLLKELSLKFSSVTEEAIVEASCHCPMLTTIKIRVSDNSRCPCLDVVLATAMRMTQLRHLQLSGYVICRKHLEIIVSSGCTHLETLDLTACVSGGKFYLAEDFEFNLDFADDVAVEIYDPLMTLLSGADFVGASEF
ncbi:putative F-box/LRR-repeat protein 23 [Heracleum sosnowskyi]|uniref:F-box/LRR-repeat protein 23 n=1 Tax=Heracleum sosnowskyi TaxID=360622 RepID=A0AAD8MJD9_9APIA|nr:putative F-box/LRR-repeat protein 23 [Heracleum sosnowskyi]